VSDLEDLCRTLDAVNQDILVMSRSVAGQAEQLRRAAAAAAAVKDDDGRTDRASVSLAAQFQYAAQQMGQAASLLLQAGAQGRAFVARTVAQSAGGISGPDSIIELAASGQPPGSGPVGSGAPDVVAPDTMGDWLEFSGDIATSVAAITGTRAAQGGLGDCGLIAALEALGMVDPGALAEGVGRNPDGSYSIRLFTPSGQVHLSVDASAPRHAAKSFAPGSSAPEYSWVTLYEKALASYLGGGYGSLHGADSALVLSLLTGRGYHQSTDVNFASVEAALAQGPVVVSTSRASGTIPGGTPWYAEIGVRPWQDVGGPDSLALAGLSRVTRAVRTVPGHAYAVAGFENRVSVATGVTERVVHLVNPWGVRGKEEGAKYVRAADLLLPEADFRALFQMYTSPDGRSWR